MFRHADVVCVCLVAVLNAAFCLTCILLMLVEVASVFWLRWCGWCRWGVGRGLGPG